MIRYECFVKKWTIFQYQITKSVLICHPIPFAQMFFCTYRKSTQAGLDDKFQHFLQFRNLWLGIVFSVWLFVVINR